MSRTKHFLDCHCQSCVNELLSDIEKFEAENTKLKEELEIAKGNLRYEHDGKLEATYKLQKGQLI